MEFILASSSPRRRELFEALRLPHRVIPSNVDEHSIADEPCDTLVARLARAKTDVCAASLNGEDRSRYSDGSLFIVAADTLVRVDSQTLGKPAGKSDAVRMLRLLSGREHEVFTGLCVSAGGRTVCRVVRTAVRFRPLDEQLIREYAATGEPADKAGAYGIQALGGVLIEGIEGDYFNVVGLPVGEMAQVLRDEWGIDILQWSM